ncbi:hypothetical protein [Rhizobium sp. BR 362]|uniref:hypothetical protein n=1 Tax=Rhizobium sp. BR 362 TaxID=3040670 RepID=UPI002F4065C1
MIWKKNFGKGPSCHGRECARLIAVPWRINLSFPIFTHGRRQAQSAQPLRFLLAFPALFVRSFHCHPVCMFERGHALLHGQRLSDPANHRIVFFVERFSTDGDVGPSDQWSQTYEAGRNKESSQKWMAVSHKSEGKCGL